MKKRMMILCASLILAGCAGQTAEPAAEEKPSEEPVIETTPEPVQETAAEDNEALAQYQEKMEPYEDMEIAFLGAISMDRTLDDILQRAASGSQLSELIAAIPDSRIFYGDRGEYTDYVYLIIPARNIDLKVGRYNWYAGEITELWIEETDAKPLIYVESGDSIDPVGRIEYVRRLSDGNTEGFMDTGLSASNSHLRTDYHMGIVDLTDYDTFDSSERPFYSQYFFDTLQTYDEVRDALNSGGNLSLMEEMIYDSHAFAVYDLEKGDKRVLYGITIDPLTREKFVIASYDSGVTWSQAGQG